MQSIGGYLITNDLDGLKSYYSNIFKDCAEINKKTFLNSAVINCPPLLSLIIDKYNKSTNLGISFNLEAFCNIENIEINTYELSRIIGIFLDNSIEAAKNASTNKEINMIIQDSPDRKYSEIIIENSFNNDGKIDESIIFEKDFSTKQKKSGIGLYKVKKILSK